MADAGVYESDFYAWATEQAALPRAGRLGEADLARIAEEIESMGKSEKRELVSRLRLLLAHLLKWRFQPAGRSSNWRLTVRERRREVLEVLADNPSLRPLLPAAVASAYATATLTAARETTLDESVFPEACPWTFEEAVSDDFWPD
jgi:hypothetical protein